MADTVALDDAVMEKVTKLDERIDKLRKRISADTAQCAKLSAKRDVLVFRSIKSKYGLEGQALADMIIREHEQAQMLGTENTPDSDNAENAVSETDTQVSETEMSYEEYEALEQLSFDDEKRNPYAD